MKMASFLGVSTRSLWSWEARGRRPPYGVILTYQQLEMFLKAEGEGRLVVPGGLAYFLECWGLLGLLAYLLEGAKDEGERGDSPY
jgi:hypothetical protein